VELKNIFGDTVNIVKSAEELLEILHPAASKGNALSFALKTRGIKAEEVIAFGYEENDLSMFAVAGFACAPQSARLEVASAADMVIASNDSDGVACFLEEHYLSGIN
jgi:hydroxymethylpyrimidine pyrophosphatase-like HAD family hydrolase